MKIKNSNIFITATNTDVGKTFITEQLIDFYSKLNFRVGVIKPIETGVINNQPLDGNRLLSKVLSYNQNYNFSISQVVPYQFELPASPFVAKKQSEININNILSKIKDLKKHCDILLIEGAGGLLVPINKNYFMIDLIKDLNVRTLLIAPSNLGSINDTLLSIEKLENSNIDFEWTINLHKDKDTFSQITEPFYKDYFNDFYIFQENQTKLANGLIYK